MTLPPLSLRGKLVAFATVLVIAPGVLIGLLAERSARSSLQTVIGRQLAREAVHSAERLSILLQSERSTLENFASQDLMREIRVSDIDKRISQALATLSDGNNVRLDYFVVDPGGQIVAASSARWIGETHEGDEDLAALIRGERHRGPFGTAPNESLGIATSIADPDGGPEALGTLVGLLHWSSLMGVLDEVRADLASQEIAATLILVDGLGRPIGTSGDPGVPVTATATSSAGFVVDKANEVIAGWAPLDGDVPPWRLLVVEPLSHALAPASDLTARLALTMALALAAALAAATLSARRVVRPLSELTDAIRGMGAGNIRGAKVPVRSDDEVGVLARTFNQMATDLDRAQQDLVEAEKFAFVGKLASGVAHEVRTSLGVLRSSAQILDRSLSAPGAPETSELVGMIRDEVGRLSGVVDDLLTLDRPRALHLEPTPHSLPLQRAVEFVEPQAREKGVAVRIEQAKRDPIVACDREALHQVCVNLLVNALEALGPDSHIDVKLSEPANGFAAFEIADDGPGIPNELRARIFEPFMTGRAKGVGLGLTFVKRVVHEHGGRISVGSSATGGACFCVEVPLSESP